MFDTPLADWLTYRPSDFLMFSPRIYWRLFDAQNADWWPLQPLLLAMAIAMLVAVRRGGLAARAALALLACEWALVAWDFLWMRFASINWIAGYYAIGFAVQVLLLLAAALAGGWQPTASRGRRRRAIELAAWALAAWALIVHPLLAWADGRPWQQAEIVGLAPDPTAIFTLALLLMLDGPTRTRWLRRALWLLPAAWCLISASTLWTMGAAQAWAMGAALVLAAVAAARGR